MEWAGKDYSAELSLLDLQTHPVANLDEQLAMFDASKGQSKAQYWRAKWPDSSPKSAASQRMN